MEDPKYDLPKGLTDLAVGFISAFFLALVVFILHFAWLNRLLLLNGSVILVGSVVTFWFVGFSGRKLFEFIRRRFK